MDREPKVQYRRAFAFRLLPEAFAAMLGTSEDPEGMVYEYHPSRDPIGARNVRGTVLPNMTNGPANTASQFPFRSTTPVPASSSAPSTPMRHVGSPGVIIYSPSVSLNFGCVYDLYL